MYIVTVHHHDKDWRNGDLEDKFELIDSRNFSTKQFAVSWMILQLKKKSGTIKTVIKTGDRPSYGYCFTGVKWQHENSGEQMEEYYQYTLKKVKLRG